MQTLNWIPILGTHGDGEVLSPNFHKVNTKVGETRETNDGIYEGTQTLQRGKDVTVGGRVCHTDKNLK